MQGFTDINYDNSPKVIVINNVKLRLRESTIYNALENNSRFYRISS